MSNNIKGVTVEIGGNTGPLIAALKGVNKTAGDLQSELREVNKQLKFDPSSTVLLQQKQTLLAKEISTTKEKLATLKEAEKQAEEQFNNGEIGEEKFRALQREVEKTESQLKGLEKQAQKAGSVLGTQLQHAGKKISDAGESISKVGEDVTKKVTVPIAAVGAASLAAFSEVDSSMDTVAEKTGATGKTLEGLQSVAENIATTIPTSFETAGNTVGEVNTRFGLTGQALQSMSTDFIKFSEINKTDVTESVQGVQEAMSAFGVKTADTQNVLGLLTSVSQKTGVSVSDLTNDLSANVATFQEAHLSIGQATTLLGNFEKAGLDSGTMMSGLKKAASTYSKEGKSMSEGLGNLIKRLQSSRTEAGATADAYKIFGTRGGLAFVNAAKSGKISLSGLSADLTQYGSTVNKTFEATENPIDKSKVALNQLKDAGAKVAEALQTALTPIIQKIIKKLKEFTNWWKQLSPQTQQMIIKVALIAAAVGPLILLIGKLITGIGGIVSGIGFLIANPIVPLIMAVVAVAALVITHWTQVKTFFIGLWNTIRGLFGNIGSWFKSIFLEAADGVIRGFDGVVSFLKGLPKKALQWGKDFIQGFVNGIKNTIGAVEDAVKKVAQKIRSFLHFSKPDEGPLADADQYGKDFMLLLEKSIKQYKDKPGDAAKEVASLVSSETAKVKDNMTASVKELNSQLEALEGRRTTALKSNSAARVSIAGSYASKIKALRREISSLEKGGKGGNSARIKALKAEISELESAEKKSSKNVKAARKSAISDEYQAKITAIKKKIAAVKDESNQEIASIKKVGDAYKAALEKQKEENDAFVKGVNSLEKEVEDALKNEYTAQEQAAEDAINKELDALEAWKTAQEDAINSVYTLRENAIQAQIDALDKEADAEDRADTRKGYTDKISDLQLQITYSHDAYNKSQLQKQLAAEQTDYQKELDKEAKDDKKAALQSQLDGVKNEQAGEIQSIDNAYNAKKTALDNQLQATKDTYAKMETDAALEAKAEQMIMADNQTAIVSLLKSYGSDYASAGSDLGDALLTGFKPKVDAISALVQGVAQQITAAQQSAAMAMAQAAASTAPRSAPAPAAKASSASAGKIPNLSISVQATKKQSVAEALQQARNVAAQIIFAVR